MVQLPIQRTLDRIPGGMTVVPLLPGALFAGASRDRADAGVEAAQVQ